MSFIRLSGNKETKNRPEGVHQMEGAVTLMEMLDAREDDSWFPW